MDTTPSIDSALLLVAAASQQHNKVHELIVRGRVGDLEK